MRLVATVGQKRRFWDTDSLIDFGKYAGRKIDFILEHDPSYLEWFMYMDGFELSDELVAAIDANLEGGAFEKMDLEYMGGHF